MRLSYSSISTYQNCPLSFKFIYIDRLPIARTPALSFGNSLHSALREFYDVPLPSPPTLEEFLGFLKKNWESLGYQDKAEEDSYFEQAQRILTQFYQSNVADFKLPVALEHRFELNFDGFTLTGVIDRIDKLESGRFEIIDYKTTRRLPPRSKVDSDLQLSIYHLATEEIWGFPPEKLTLYFLVPNVKISTTRSQEDIEETKRKIKDTLSAISEKKFDPRENALCPYCDFQERCPLFSQKFTKEKFADQNLKIEEVIDEFAELRKSKKEIEKRLNELTEIIHNYCEEHNATRLFSDNFIITRGRRVIQNYNVDKLREILTPLGLWEKIITVDSQLLKELLNSEQIEDEIKKAIETAKEVEEISYALYVREIQQEP